MNINMIFIIIIVIFLLIFLVLLWLWYMKLMQNETIKDDSIDEKKWDREQRQKYLIELANTRYDDVILGGKKRVPH